MVLLILSFDVFQVVTPTGNVLVNDLSLQVASGSNLLITGNFLQNICIALDFLD